MPLAKRKPRHAAPQGPRPSLPVLAFGSALGAGYAPVASGTVGSAAALAVYWLLPALASGPVLTALTLVVTMLGIPAASAMERWYGEDPSEVVIDEVAGMWVALLFLPRHWLVSVIAFLAFRAFDILKPPPVRQLDRMHGGTGIMLDDIAAGVYANAVTWLAVLLVPSAF